jgi:hypothetical protein
MPGLLDAIRDPEFWGLMARQAPSNLLEAVKGNAAGLLGGPVDIATMAMKPFGYNVESPVMSSEWIRKKTQQPRTTAYNIGEMLPMGVDDLARLAAPVVATAGGLLAMHKMAGSADNIPALTKALKRQQGMFIGKNAKTWDAAKAKQAEELLAKGADPREVWKQTGTFRGVDNALRQEIPDNISHRVNPMKENKPAGWTPQNVGEYTIAPFIDAYPDIGKLKIDTDSVYGVDPFGSVKGAYANDTIYMQPTGDDSYTTALHEIQHAIQQREGWARGGSPEAFVREVTDARFKVDELSQKLERLENQAGAEADLWLQKYPEKVREALDYIKQKGLYDDADDIREMVKYAIFDQDPIYQSFTKQWRDAKQMAHTSPTDAYRRLAGEAEARLTQSRMNMTMPERLQSYPYDMLDVPQDQLIVRGLLGWPALSYADEAAKKAKK